MSMRGLGLQGVWGLRLVALDFEKEYGREGGLDVEMGFWAEERLCGEEGLEGREEERY